MGDQQQSCPVFSTGFEEDIGSWEVEVSEACRSSVSSILPRLVL